MITNVRVESLLCEGFKSMRSVDLDEYAYEGIYLEKIESVEGVIKAIEENWNILERWQDIKSMAKFWNIEFEFFNEIAIDLLKPQITDSKISFRDIPSLRSKLNFQNLEE